MSVYEALDFVLSGLRTQDTFLWLMLEWGGGGLEWVVAIGSAGVAGHVWHVCGVAVARVLP